MSSDQTLDGGSPLESGSSPGKGEVTWSVHLPVSRMRAFTRGMLWATPAFLLGAVSFSIYRSLSFTPTGVSNRLVEYSLAFFALPLPIITLWTLIRSLRWLLLSCWPGSLGVFADDRELMLALGPFGMKSYDIARLDVRYLFELSADLEDEGFEAFLPEEEQKERFLPRMVHPDTVERINHIILSFVAGDEAVVASILRPAIERWRSQQGMEQITREED